MHELRQGKRDRKAVGEPGRVREDGSSREKRRVRDGVRDLLLDDITSYDSAVNRTYILEGRLLHHGGVRRAFGGQQHSREERVHAVVRRGGFLACGDLHAELDRDLCGGRFRRGDQPVRQCRAGRCRISFEKRLVRAGRGKRRAGRARVGHSDGGGRIDVWTVGRDGFGRHGRNAGNVGRTRRGVRPVGVRGVRKSSGSGYGLHGGPHLRRGQRAGARRHDGSGLCSEAWELLLNEM